MSSLFEKQRKSSLLFGSNAAYIESFYEQFLKNPESVSEEWRGYFRDMQKEDVGKSNDVVDVAHGPIKESFEQLSKEKRISVKVERDELVPELAAKQASVLRLINAYRVRGHQNANLDPLSLWDRPAVSDLEPTFHGLTEADMDTVFNTGSLQVEGEMTLRQIHELVKGVYTQTIGAEYMHIVNTDEKRWIQSRLEGTYGQEHHSPEQKQKILMQLTAAEGIEKYLHTKYVGQKRFSLEGGDSLIPAIQEVVSTASGSGVEEVVIAMAHRGRLNVLVNVMGKSPSVLFEEFEGKAKFSGSGDVKYHMGFSTDVEVEGKRVHLVLAFNPSHLEIVNPVVEGSVKARQDRRGDTDGREVLPLVIHGDSAFAGQGVVPETLQMSQIRGFKTGGTVHIIVNNQVGFTTSRPDDTRSTEYCSDVAKFISAPVFHVNGDDPEAVAFVTRLAMDYRTEFGKDVVIDLMCYRRHGHNEADEPAATQPVMYKNIRARETTRAIYAKRLLEEQVIEESHAQSVIDEYRAGLDDGKNIAVKTLGFVGNEYTIDWDKYNVGAGWDQEIDTKMALEDIQRLSKKMTTLPEGHALHSRVKQIVSNREKMAAGGLALDWGFAETMAYAGLIEDGFQVRLVGQDAGRGTFFHRHAVLHNQNDGSNHTPLKHIRNEQDFTVIDSFLSEEAVLGFEYGYSTAEPNDLVIWEAQFGDFANGAQVVIDQFIAAGEAKWGRFSGLTLFLPHGYEGQGPEHSSARLERYLQLCAEHNIQVCVPSTPSQMFHMIRRQMIRSMRRPLIVMTPKSLLRNKLSTSSLEDLSDNYFRPVLDDRDGPTPDEINRIVFCSGKVFYDLLEARRKLEMTNVALVRLEQIYPFPQDDYQAVLDKYDGAKDVIWCQEEPENQGAWYQIRHRLEASLNDEHTLEYAGRPASASTAAGSMSMHVSQQKSLIAHALDAEQQ